VFSRLRCRALVVILVRTPRRERRRAQLAAVTVFRVLLSPIAWDHYWTLMFPAFLIPYDSRDQRLLGRAGGCSERCGSHHRSFAADACSGFSAPPLLVRYTIAAVIVRRFPDW
jgi:hypothetical protein